MATQFRILPGLPPYSLRADSFPEEWGSTGQEGFVVEFRLGDGSKWIGNFRGGYSKRDAVRLHPDGVRILVLATGELWIVDPASRQANRMGLVIDDSWEVPASDDLILSRQGLALLRFGATGVVWHTRRLSWDGLDEIRLAGEFLEGSAWSPLDDCWRPFRVNIETGESLGGSYSDGDPEGWEHLAT